MREGKFHQGLVAALILVLVLVLASAAACGGRDDSAEPAASESAGVELTKIAVITPEKGNDYGWNQQGVEGAQKAADAIGAELIVQDGAGYGDITPIMEQVALGRRPVHLPVGERLQHRRARRWPRRWTSR